MLKAKQKTVSILLACLTMLAALVFGLVSFFKTPTTTASAAAAYVETPFGEGKLLITTTFNGSTYYLPATTASSSPNAVSFTNVNDISEDHLWTVTADGSKYKIQNSKGEYLYTTSSNSGVRVGTTERTWSYNSSNNYFQDSSTSRFLGIYNAQDWRCYTTVNQSNYKESSTSFKFYKVGDGTACAHENATPEITTKATCTTAGEKTWTCPDCDYEWPEAIEATGHNTTETITTEATCTTTGEKAIACNDCGNEETEVIPATGHTYVEGVCTVCGAEQPTSGSEDLSIYSTTGALASDKSNISWEGDYFTVIHTKGNTAIRTSDNDHFRAYAGSTTTINLTPEGFRITEIVIVCTSNDYATVCAGSLNTEGATATANGTNVTITVKDGTTSVSIGATAQWRLNKITVSYSRACAHENVTTETVNATCTENGSITVTCGDCGQQVSTQVLEATGHSLDEGVITTQPQVGVDGVKTYTCQNGCGYTETESIPALDATKYTLSYSVPNGVEAPDSVEIANGETITLADITAPEGFTFLGWASEECKETKTAPTYLTADSEYTLEVEENVTLYALFTYSAGSGDFVKVTENRDDWSGEYLIVYEKGNDAYVFNAADAVNGYVSATISDSIIEYSDTLSAETVTIEAMTGGYSIKTKEGYIYGVSGSNALKFNTNAAQLNTISLDAKGDIEIISNTSYLRFNSASNQMRFRYYKSGQQAIALYALDGATYYATDLSVKIDSASVTVGDSLTVNYKVSMPAVYADAVMHFTLDGNVIEANGTINADGQYVFSLPVPPQAMADNIAAELYFGEILLASMAEYSIQTYAQNFLNKAESSEELKQLLTDMLYYGAAAQKYKGYNTENLATAGVENLGTPSTAVPTATYTLVNNPDATEYPAYIKSAGVYFDTVNNIYVRLNTVENVKVYVTINGGERFELNVKAGTTYYTDGISATGFATEYVFEVEYDGVLMQTLTYSVNAYVYAMKDNNDAMSELALALYRYGVSAEAYKLAEANNA